MKKADNKQRLRTFLLSGAKKPGDLQRALSVSQPTFSRLIRNLKSEITVLGAGRSTLYAGERTIDQLGSQVPVFQVDTQGNIRPFGILEILQNGEYGWFPPKGPGQLFKQLPWFIQAMRPEGFVGRAFAHRFRRPGVPDRLSDWNDDHLLLMLTFYSFDLPGNLIVGHPSLEKYLTGARRQDPGLKPDQRAEHYPLMAAKAMAGDPPGSSAGGEQPKFGAILDGSDPRTVMVKFSPPAISPEGRRWADLLICEALALETIRNAGYRASKAEVFWFDNRVFLEVKRFDRVGCLGRIGAVPLSVIDDEFYGFRDNWCQAAERLKKDAMLSADDAAAVCWLDAFSGFIANTDKHFGNITLFIDGPDKFRLAPAYDILPMFFRPVSTGELIERSYVVPECHEKAWKQRDSALRAACEFWQAVQQDDRISDDFCQTAKQLLSQLNKLEDGPKVLLASSPD